MLQLGKEEFIDILKDQHPNFNQSASNGVLVSLNENTCSGCTAFKIFISILFTAFDDLNSWVNLVALFPLVGDPGKACKILWNTFQFLSPKSSAGMLACGYFIAPFASSSHVH